MDNKVWNEGEPPHIGWWLTKDRHNVQRWCWWDGNFFLYYAQAVGNLLWSDYYPENARVPRVDPSLPGSGGVVAYINASKDGNDMWARAAWEMYRRVQTPAAAGSTRTVREMKERLTRPRTTDPLTSTMHIPSTAPDREKVVVPRLSESVRIGDADFSGAMYRNTDPSIPKYQRRGDTEGVGHAHLRSNGQAQAAVNPEPREIGDPFNGITTLALLKEVVRRLNV